MGAEKLRERLRLLVDHADERLLRMLLALGDAYDAGEFWQGMDDGQKEALRNDIGKGEEDARQGKVHTVEEARKILG